MYLSKSRTTPKNKMSAKKKYFIINFIHSIHHTWHVSFHFPLPNSVTVAIFTVNVFVFLTFTPNIFNLFTAIPQHIISLIHCTGYTAYLTTLHSQLCWDALPCSYDTHLLNTTFLFLGLWTEPNPWSFTIFSNDGVSGVKNLNTCVQNCCVVSVLWSGWVHVCLYGF